jgi:hypothetical protein
MQAWRVIIGVKSVSERSFAYYLYHLAIDKELHSLQTIWAAGVHAEAWVD